MSWGGSFQLMQTLRKSPAVLRRRFHQDRAQALSHGDPLFKVHYLGTEKIYSLDVEQAAEAIGRLLEKSPDAATLDKLGKEHALVVRPRYVEVKEISTSRQLTKTYLKDIAYCAADTTRPNVFLYICKQRGQQLHCRVFWCSRPDRARDMTACLARYFQRALNDLLEDETNHTKEEEESTKDEKPLMATGQNKSSTLPADMRKGQWRKRSPLRELMRRTSISD